MQGDHYILVATTGPWQESSRVVISSGIMARMKLGKKSSSYDEEEHHVGDKISLLDL